MCGGIVCSLGSCSASPETFPPRFRIRLILKHERLCDENHAVRKPTRRAVSAALSKRRTASPSWIPAFAEWTVTQRKLAIEKHIYCYLWQCQKMQTIKDRLVDTVSDLYATLSHAYYYCQVVAAACSSHPCRCGDTARLVHAGQRPQCRPNHTSRGLWRQ